MDKKQRVDIETKTNVGAIIAVGISIFAVLIGAFMTVLGLMGL